MAEAVCVQQSNHPWIHLRHWSMLSAAHCLSAHLSRRSSKNLQIWCSPAWDCPCLLVFWMDISMHTWKTPTPWTNFGSPSLLGCCVPSLDCWSFLECSHHSKLHALVSECLSCWKLWTCWRFLDRWSASWNAWLNMLFGLCIDFVGCHPLKSPNLTQMSWICCPTHRRIGWRTLLMTGLSLSLHWWLQTVNNSWEGTNHHWTHQNLGTPRQFLQKKWICQAFLFLTSHCINLWGLCLWIQFAWWARLPPN